jgi:4-alpha-glucanotransferase
MKVNFNIHYATQWGQMLRLLRYADNSTGSRIVAYYDMLCNGSAWNVELEIADNEKFYYRYAVVSSSQPMFFEYGKLRKFSYNVNSDQVRVNDAWRVKCGETPFESSAFTNCIFKRNEKPKTLQNTYNSGELLIKLHCPKVEKNHHIAILGNQEILGNWQPEKKLKLNDAEFPVFSILLNVKDLHFPVEYKFVIVENKTNKIIAWETGENRRIEYADQEQFTIKNDICLQSDLPNWRGTGTAIPIFSLRSNSGMGTGEFTDLKLLIDWAAANGQSLIQTLPVNDTVQNHTNADSYPYNAISVFALHLLYLNLEQVGTLKNKRRRNFYSAKQEEFNSKNFVDYQNVMKIKWQYVNEILEQEGNVFLDNPDFRHFFENNKNWLVPYAAFSYLRDFYNTANFRKWEKFSVFNLEEIKKLTARDSEFFSKIAIHYFIQYHLHRQLSDVHQYAQRKGIALKGDIPIGVSRNSVEIWTYPELFDEDMQIGAPPDDFAVIGQNWGFPAYKWDIMARDDYAWWKSRFRKMADYFDAYRIDHILGFFRIWQIPITDMWGLTGMFSPALPFTVRELEERGLTWYEALYTQPYITESILKTTFGENTDKVKKQFFEKKGNEFLEFKPQFNTQRKINDYFAKQKADENGEFLKNNLLMLCCDVLFIRDKNNPNCFHPRISLHNTFIYKSIDGNVKQTLNDIYNYYFYVRHNELWKQEALKRLPPLLNATNMLVCGEDLGMIPASVPEIMNELEILSLEIQRMPKSPNEEFSLPENAPYLSVCSTSTHDMNPLRAWWEETAETSQHFYNNILNIEGNAPQKMTQHIAEEIIKQHLHGNAMWTILPLQDWLSTKKKLWRETATEERINVPADNNNFWSYRMHITLEELLKVKIGS